MANGFNIERDIDDDGEDETLTVQEQGPTTTKGKPGKLKQAASSFASAVGEGAKRAARDVGSAAKSLAEPPEEGPREQRDQRIQNPQPGQGTLDALMGGPLEPDSTSAETPPENTDEAAANALMGLGFNQPGDPAAMVAVDENRNGRFERQEITMFPPGEGMPESFDEERGQRETRRRRREEPDRREMLNIGQDRWL